MIGDSTSSLRNGLCAGAERAQAAAIDTTESSQYLIIVRMRINSNTGVSTNNFELGANKAPVPSNTIFLDSGGGLRLLARRRQSQRQT